MADEDTTQPQPEVEAPVEDVRSALNAAFEAQDAPAEAAPRATAEPDAPDADKPDRPRGPDGKFIRAEGDAEPEPAAAAPQQAEKPAADKSAEPVAAATTKEPPTNWPDAHKTMFKGLPGAAQEFLLGRYNEMTADYTRKTQEIASIRREYEPIAQMFAPYQDVLRQRGTSVAGVVQAWYDVERQLMSGGPTAVAALARVAQNYKIPPDQVAAALGIRPTAQQPQPPQLGPDGQMPAIEQPPGQQIQLPPEIVQRLTEHDQWIAQEQHRQQLAAYHQHQQAGQRVMNEIDQFAAATDNAGATLHPYFKEVEDDMTRLALAAQARGGTPPPLSELYDQAVWANPSTRAQLLAANRAADEAQRAAAEEKRKADVRAKAEQSRRAGASVSGAPGSTSQAAGRPRSSGSVREDLMATVEALADA